MLVLLLASLPLHAFAPPKDLSIGIEPQRVQDLSPGAQDRVRRGAAWQTFVKGEGAGWQARFDEVTGTVHRAWGPGVPMVVRDAASVEKSVRGFLARHPEIVGVPLDELVLHSARPDATGDRWFVDFHREIGGVPIWRAGFTARIVHGRLVMFGADTYPGAKDLGPPEVDAHTAVATAIVEGYAPDAVHSEETARLLYVPLARGESFSWHLVWEVRTRTFTPAGKWVSFIDAFSGEPLATWNEVRFLDGVVYGTHDDRTVNGSFLTSALPLLTITGSDGRSASADAAGSFSLAATTGTATLTGTWLTVRNSAGREGSLTVSDAAPVWTDAAATQAEIDSYVFLHHVHAFAQTFSPDIDLVTGTLRSNVNEQSTCNAYFDGNVNFYEAGDGCNNTGRIADVNYHEWGHGLHYYSIPGDGYFDGSISEGIGDFTSAMMTADADIAPYFYTTGGAIREIDSDRVYPDDVVNEVHEDGLIYGGAMWDLWENLDETYGEARSDRGTAWTTLARLFTTSIRSGATIPDIYDEVVVADDDDGNLGNGTPHLCEIADAFARHGLGPGGSAGLFGVSHAPIVAAEADVAATVFATAVELAPGCVEGGVDRMEAVYSIDAGDSWDTVPLTAGDTAFTGDLPAFPDGTVVWYYLRAESDDGDVTAPDGGEITPYSFYVGGVTPIWCEDFSAGDGDFTHELLDGTEQEGADDWTFGEPAGYEGDPTSAWTGSDVWGNDLGGGRYNGAYQPSIVNRLSSPEIDLQGATDLVVQFRRWLNVEDGVYDQARVYANDEEVWANHLSSRSGGEEHHQDTEWIQHTLALTTNEASLVLGWEIDSDEGLEFGGWNIDDVCVYRAGTPSAFSVDDFDASDDRVGEVFLRWTQPAGADEAVVVRRDDRFPLSATDGELVYEGAGESGAASATDPYVGTAYYAVFVGADGVWTSGAVEGGNADVGEGLPNDGGLDTDDGNVKLRGSCGCASASGASTVPWLALLGLAALARRRR